MAKDPTSPDDRASQQKARRKPLTIDLPAAEVGRKPGEGALTASASTASDASANSQSGSRAEAKGDAPAASAAADSSGARSAPVDPVIPSAFATQGRAEAPKSAKPDAPSGPRPESDRRRGVSPFLVAAFAGAAIAAIVIAVLALSGYFAPAKDDGAETAAAIADLKAQIAALREAPDSAAPLRAQVAALEKSVADLSARPLPPAADPAGLKDLQDRLGKLEAAPPVAAGPDANLEPRLTALADDIAALKNAAPPDIASFQATLATLRTDIDALAARVGGLPGEERIAGIEAKLADIGQQVANAAALAPAVAADGLAAALDAGRPFANELAALQRLGIDSDAAKALASQAESGLPTIADLSAEFERAIEAVPLFAPIPESAGTVDRLLQSARSLVSVRPAHPTAGSDPAATVARIRGALAAGDLKSALAEWTSLPDAVKAPTTDWAKAAEARMHADALAAEVRAAALAHLGAGQ